MTRSRLSLCALIVPALWAGLAQAAQPDDVQLQASRRVVVYGERLTVTGTVPTDEPGDGVVTILERPFGTRAFVVVATVAAGPDGRFRHVVRPRLETSYRAARGDARSASVTVRVRPRVTVRVDRRALLTAVTASRSLIGKTVVLQRRLRNRWVFVRRAVLQSRIQRVQTRLPGGVLQLRIVIPRRQAGPGYLAGVSRVVRVRS